VVLLFDVNGTSAPVLARAVRAAGKWIEKDGTKDTLWAVAAVGTEAHLILPYTGDVARFRRSFSE